MKMPVCGVVLVALMAAGCATGNKSQEAAQHTMYNKPLTSPGAKFGALPPPVQLSVLAQVGAAAVVDTVRDTSSGQVVYKVYFRESDLFPPMYIAPDGSMLNPDLTVAVSARTGTRVKPEDVPPKVKKAIPEKAHSSEVAYINKEMWGERTIYVVTFKDEAHNPKLLLDEEGVVVHEAQP
ncbi:MAG TPA: hypothetical protein PLV05_04205 [Verrucomicrobiota bacterium]|jgi:hypothetical protein|nr:hypothetical protein [Verrucomicrobiota bacterium]OQC24163.1 MAG: hypothetical protein BWX68_02369 [Verrucomicrobia bacterium ADurb.Bin063]HRR64501.1 hypothetical protein [Candidatus Paceibacterota bacterium]MBP8014309.1 hypothetical protein [Verrucomicrobiota bacterium]MDI9373206.1 hypothetical protein [Verrucomicrobiota bacterium]